MTESFHTRVQRLGFNFFPAYRRTGARITYIRADWREVHVKLPLTWRTRNYVGTLFGGSMFAAADPIYMVMWLKVLPKGHRVWVKHGEIDFRRPGRETLHLRFEITDEELASVGRELEGGSPVQRMVEVPLTTTAGETCALVRQTLHFRGA